MKHDHSDHKPGEGHGGNSPDTPSTSVDLNPDVVAHLRTSLLVEGMDCADEVTALRESLARLRGVRSVQVNLVRGAAVVEHDSTVSLSDLTNAAQAAGLRARSSDQHETDKAKPSGQRSRFVSVLLSGLLTGAGLLCGWANLMPESVRNGLFALATISGGWFIAPKAFRALRDFRLDMNVLMTVAVAGAIAIGEWSEGAAVTFLFALSELLEAFSLNRARRAIASLLELAPETALVKEGAALTERPVETVAVDSIVAIKSGMKVPLDGMVIEGESSINQAPITGESMPVEKKVGDTVFAGTINGDGSLVVKVSKAHADTTLSRIIKLVEEAQNEKAPSQKFVDRFARIYTPAVFVVALGVLLLPPLVFGQEWAPWIYRSLVLLVIACPCALVISTPVSIVSGLTAMARRGVLIKGGIFLEEVGRLRALAVDKTGTITEGKPKVQKVVTRNGFTEKEVIQVAAAIDAHSEHPLAKAVMAYADANGVDYSRSTKYQARSGRGAEGEINEVRHIIGNHRFAHELGLCSPEIEAELNALESQALSVVVVGRMTDRKEVLGILGLGDSIRPGAKAALAALHAAGIQKVVMLSGDNQKTVDAISKQVGIDQAFGDLLPEAKIEHVRRLLKDHGSVGMIGDGVNDAPAMAVASIGIAMGGVGTDTAIETADIALMQDDLSKIAEAVSLGRKTLGVIRTNIAFSLLVKAVFLVLAFAGITSLWLAILADTGATLLVIANALRLLRRPGKS